MTYELGHGAWGETPWYLKILRFPNMRRRIFHWRNGTLIDVYWQYAND